MAANTRFPAPFNVKSTLIRPANTTAYVQNALIASSASASALIVPSFSFSALLSPDIEAIELSDGLLFSSSEDVATATFGIDLWIGPAPTFVNGDGGAYSVASGMPSWVGGGITVVTASTESTQRGLDGRGSRFAIFGINDNQPFQLAIGRNQLLYWSMFELDATGFTPVASAAYTLTLRGKAY